MVNNATPIQNSLKIDENIATSNVSNLDQNVQFNNQNCKCQFCPQTFGQFAELERHFESFHQGQTSVASNPIQNSSYNQLRMEEFNEESAIDDDDEVEIEKICDICNEVFDTKQELGMISHKKSLITSFGHKHEIK